MSALLRGITRNGSQLSALQPPCTVQNGCCMRHPRACGSVTRDPHDTALSDTGPRDGAPSHQMMRPEHGNRTDSVAHDLFGVAGLHRSVKYVGATTTLPTLGFPSQVRAEVNEWILQKYRECPLCNTLPLRHAGNYSFRMLDYVGPMDIVCSPEKASCTSGSVTLRPRPTPCDHASAAAYWFALDGTQAHFHHFMMEWLPQLAYLLAIQELEMLSGNISLVVDHLIANSPTLRQALLALKLPVEAVQALSPGGQVCVRRLLLGEKLVQNFGAVSFPASRFLQRFHTSLQRSNYVSLPSLGASNALLYVDRLDAPYEQAHYKRVLTNQAELASELAARGFEMHSISELTFVSRVQLLSRARLVLMQAGTSQVNALFMRPFTTLAVIAHPLGASLNWNTVWYSWLCDIAHCSVAMLNNTVISKRRALEPWQNSYTAELKPLLTHLDAIIASLSPRRSKGSPPSCEMNCDMVDHHSRSKRNPAKLPRDSSRLNTCALTCGTP